MTYNKRKNNKKKGVSAILGYVLMVTFTVVLGLVVYGVLKTYAPQQQIDCPQETSLLVTGYNYDCDNKILSIDITNDGKFSIGGYFIYATDSPDKDLATLDLSSLNMEENKILKPSGVIFGTFADEERNSLAPNSVESDDYNLTTLNKQVYKIEIVPLRWETRNRRMMVVSCKNADTKKVIECS